MVQNQDCHQYEDHPALEWVRAHLNLEVKYWVHYWVHHSEEAALEFVALT